MRLDLGLEYRVRTVVGDEVAVVLLDLVDRLGRPELADMGAILVQDVPVVFLIVTMYIS